MMKKLLLFAALAVASWLGAVDTALLKYIPANAAGLGVIEVAKLAEHPEIKAALEDPKSVGAFQALGIAPKDVREIAVFYVDDNFNGVIVRVADGKTLKAKLDASPLIRTGGNAVQIAAMDVNGMRVYRCSKQGENDAVCATFIAADALVFTSESVFAAYQQAPKIAGSPQFPNAAKAAVWGFYNNPDFKADSQDGQLVSVEAMLDVVGEKKQDVDVTAILNCNREDYAGQMSMMIPGMVQMGCGMLFAEKPEIGQKIIGMFKSTATGKAVRLSLRITPEVAKVLSDCAAAAAGAESGDNAAKPQGGAPAAK